MLFLHVPFSSQSIHLFLCVFMFFDALFKFSVCPFVKNKTKTGYYLQNGPRFSNLKIYVFTHLWISYIVVIQNYLSVQLDTVLFLSYYFVPCYIYICYAKSVCRFYICYHMSFVRRLEPFHDDFLMIHVDKHVNVIFCNNFWHSGIYYIILSRVHAIRLLLCDYILFLL